MSWQIILVDIGEGLALGGVLPSAVVGDAYSARLAARGGRAPYTYTIMLGAAALASAGLNLDPATGELAGTASTVGAYPITVRATDLTGRWVERSYVIAVIAAIATGPALTIMGHVTYRRGEVSTYPYLIEGGTPPYTASISAGALPDGMTMSAAGIVYGWYTGPDDFAWTVDVVDAAGQHATLNDSLVHSNTMVYVTDSYNGVVRPVDPARVLANAAISVGAYPVALTTGTDASIIYSANNGDSTVSVMYLMNDPVYVETIGVGSGPQSVCTSLTGQYLYCVNNADASVSKVNLYDTSDTSTFAVGTSPSTIRINPVTGELYIVDSYESSVFIRDGAGAGSIYDYLYVPYASGVAVDATGTHVFVCGGDTLTVFEVASRVQVGSVAMDGASLIAVALSRDGRYVFAAANSSHNLYVIDVTNPAAPVLVCTVDAGDYQVDVAADPNVDDMYVSLGLGGVISVHASGLFDVSPLADYGDGGIVVVRK